VSRQTDVGRIRVAAGVLRDDRGRVLIAERTEDHTFAGLWEFPGGKVSDGEETIPALRRELREELGVEVLDQSLLMSIEHDYPDRSVCIDFYLIDQWNNLPEGKDGQALKWIKPDELTEDQLLPADGPLVDVLRRLSGRHSTSI
jgi:8-oxo-dGTP diphosphatase